MPEYLLIGGANDGKRVQLPGHRQVLVVPVPKPMPPLSIANAMTMNEPHEVEHYELMVFRDGDFWRHVYASSGLNSRQVFEMLIDGYRRI